jgi:calcyphosin
MAFYGVGIDAEVARLILEVKLKLSSLYGCYGLRQLDLAYRRNDVSGQGVVLKDDFVEILNGTGVFLKQIEYQALTKLFGKGNDQVCYVEFVNRFREKLSAKREDIIAEIFDRLDVNRNGAVELHEISKS